MHLSAGTVAGLIAPKREAPAREDETADHERGHEHARDVEGVARADVADAIVKEDDAAPSASICTEVAARDHPGFMRGSFGFGPGSHSVFGESERQ